MLRLWVVALVALSCLVSWPRLGHADDDQKTERARVHLKAAIAYYDEARYEDAAHEMEAAYALKPLPDLQYNLAQCYERLGRYDAAAQAYETYLGGNAQAADRKLVTMRINNLRERAKALQAGSAAALANAPPPAEKVVFKTLVVYKEAPPPPGRGVRYAAIGAAVVGAGALAAGIAFAVLASQQANTVTHGGSTTNPPIFDGNSRVAQSTGKSDVIVSGVAFGVAGLCAGGALGLWLLGHKIDQEAPKLSLAPSFSPTSGGLTVVGRF